MKYIKWTFLVLVMAFLFAGGTVEVEASTLRGALDNVIERRDTLKQDEEASLQRLAEKSDRMEKLSDIALKEEIRSTFFEDRRTMVEERLARLEEKQIAPLKKLFLNLTNGYRVLEETDIILIAHSETKFEEAMASDLREEDMETIREALEARIREFDMEIRRAKALALDVELERESLETVVEEIETTVVMLTAELEVVSEEQAQLEKEIEAERQRALAAERERQNSFLKPTSGRITSGFGNRRHPVTGRTAFHAGIDIANRTGTRVVASKAGTVEFAGWRGNYGRLIIINHGNGQKTYYAHLNSQSVRAGQRVNQGQQIGTVGSTGRSTGPHLHFEIHINGRPVNPASYMR